jgi:hypothetical protein
MALLSTKEGNLQPGTLRLVNFSYSGGLGSKILMVIALGNVIRMCMSDDASFWALHRQNAAPKGKKILQQSARMSNSTKKLNIGDVHDPRSRFRKMSTCNAKPT